MNLLAEIAALKQKRFQAQAALVGTIGVLVLATVLLLRGVPFAWLVLAAALAYQLFFVRRMMKRYECACMRLCALRCAEGTLAGAEYAYRAVKPADLPARLGLTPPAAFSGRPVCRHALRGKLAGRGKLAERDAEVMEFAFSCREKTRKTGCLSFSGSLFRVAPKGGEFADGDTDGDGNGDGGTAAEKLAVGFLIADDALFDICFEDADYGAMGYAPARLADGEQPPAGVRLWSATPDTPVPDALLIPWRAREKAAGDSPATLSASSLMALAVTPAGESLFVTRRFYALAPEIARVPTAECFPTDGLPELRWLADIAESAEQ